MEIRHLVWSPGLVTWSGVVPTLATFLRWFNIAVETDDKQTNYQKKGVCSLSFTVGGGVRGGARGRFMLIGSSLSSTQSTVWIKSSKVCFFFLLMFLHVLESDDFLERSGQR